METFPTAHRSDIATSRVEEGTKAAKYGGRPITPGKNSNGLVQNIWSVQANSHRRSPAFGASKEVNKSPSPNPDGGDDDDVPPPSSSCRSDDVTAAGEAGGDSLSSFMRDCRREEHDKGPRERSGKKG